MPYHPYPSTDVLAALSDDEGMMVMGGRTIAAWAQEHSTPLFLYDRQAMSARVQAVREALPARVKIHYAMKANPHPGVVRHMVGITDGLDIASGGELAIALRAGAQPETLGFAGPGKTNAELVQAIKAGIVLTLESESEADRVAQLVAQGLPQPVSVAIRINPPFGLKGAAMRMGGKAQPFGIDADRVPALLARLSPSVFDVQGLHIYLGSQTLNPQTIIEAQQQSLDLMLALARHAAPHTMKFFNIGGGFGVPYFAHETALDVTHVGRALAKTLQARDASLQDIEIRIELGRYLVSEAGVYITRIVDRKHSYGETFLIVDGGLHHQLAAAGLFGQVIRRNYPVALANRMRAPVTEEVTIVGCLCTPLDRLAERVHLPEAQIGDFIAIFQAGAYGLSASPTGFLSHALPIECVL